MIVTSWCLIEIERSDLQRALRLAHPAAAAAAAVAAARQRLPRLLGRPRPCTPGCTSGRTRSAALSARPARAAAAPGQLPSSPP